MPRKAASTAAKPRTPHTPSGFSTARISRLHLWRRRFKQLSVASCQLSEENTGAPILRERQSVSSSAPVSKQPEDMKDRTSAQQQQIMQLQQQVQNRDQVIQALQQQVG